MRPWFQSPALKKKVLNQDSLPTQQRVTLISVAYEVRHTKHAKEKKKEKMLGSKRKH
jgi:hypothetical protein